MERPPIDHHPFDDLKVTEAVYSLEHAFNWKSSESVKNPLYYVNFFQYRHGDLYRAILGKEIIYDREWEAQHMITLDKTLSHPEHICQVLKYTAARMNSLRGIFWRWNCWQKEHVSSSITLHPDSKTLIYIRRNRDLLDIEGPINLPGGSVKNGVLTMKWSIWQKRYAHLFREVQLENGNERSTYQNQDTPWREIPNREWWSRRTKEERLASGIVNPSDLLPPVFKADRSEGSQKTSESVRPLPSRFSPGMVLQPWRVLENFRGTALKDYIPGSYK